MKPDKERERQRYNERAQDLLNSGVKISGNSIPLLLQAPYIFYKDAIEVNVLEKARVLEIGAGTGAFTAVLLNTGSHICATDISAASLGVIKRRFTEYSNLSVEVADMESLPFKDEVFDVVTSAGSLSYGDNNIVMNEIYRVLKCDGVFIAVDSLNHNPIYRLNRWIHYVRGNRTMSTLKRMPKLSLIAKYNRKFGESDCRFFGSISWSFPVLKLAFSERLIAKITTKIDLAFNIKKSAFKFVMVARKTK
jgi:SAM-dependent methyltransferase